MRITSALIRMICEEPISGQRLERIEFYRVQGEAYEWLCMWLSLGGAEALRAVAAALSPIRPHEAFVDCSEGEVWHASDGPFAQKAISDGISLEDRWEEFPRGVVDRTRREGRGNVLLARVVRDDSLFDLDVLIRRLDAATWLGLRIPSEIRPDREIELVLGGQRRTLTSTPTSPVAFVHVDGHSLAFYESPPEPVVRVSMWVPGCEVAHKSISAGELMEALRISRNRYYGYRVRLPVMMEVVSEVALSDEELRSLITDNAATFSRIRSACLEAIDRSVREGIDKLESRRAALVRRDRLRVVSERRHVDIGRVPTNESEVLILVGKLHPYIAKELPRFDVHEHTSLLGIDALADIQLFPDAQATLSTTLEFEYSLANFFRHEHPVRQTSFVICWTIGELPDIVHYSPRDGKDTHVDPGPSEIILLGSGWIRRLNFGDHLLYVMIIEEFPGLHRSAA